MSENLANNATTILGVNVLVGDSQIHVMSSVGFPSPSFRILIDGELMVVTGVSGTLWTVTRGVEGTTAAGHTAGAGIASVLTVAGLEAFITSHGSGTVSSVDLSMPSGFSVSGNPITTSGTLAVTYSNEPANQVLAGPSSGSAATPAFRSLVAADIPALPESAITGLVTDLAGKLSAGANLSDLGSASTGRTNLGLGSAAIHPSTDFLLAANNLSDVTASTARTNLGLGTAATLAAGAANGVATLDGSGHLTSSQIPSSLVGAVVYVGTWNASTNTPTLASGVGSKGNYYKVSVAGSTSIDGIGVWNADDTIIFDGSTWDKIDGTISPVLSFNGRTGAVTPQTGDYTATNVGLGNVSNNLQLTVANNLSDLASASTARTNLGLGSAALSSSSAFDTSGAAAAAQAASLQITNNLSDLGSAATARTNLGLFTVQTISFSSTVTPVGSNPDSIVNIGTLTGPITIAAPSGSPSERNKMELRFSQDATGGRAITWDTAFAFGSDVTTSLIPTAANAAWEMFFVYHAGSSKWRCMAIARGF